MCRTKIYWLGKFCNIDDAITADAVSRTRPELSKQCMGVYGFYAYTYKGEHFAGEKQNSKKILCYIVRHM